MKFKIDKSSLEIQDKCTSCLSSSYEVISDLTTLAHDSSEKLSILTTSFCSQCGHIWRSKRPKEDWFFKMFQERHALQSQENFNPINDDVEIYRQNRYKELLAYLQVNNYLPSKDIDKFSGVDFGCGTGTGLIPFLENNLPIFGVEVDHSRASYGISKGLKIIVKPWQSVSSEIHSCNFATSIHSLEHFYNPDHFLSHLNSHLAESALLYIEVPNSAYINDWTDALYLSHINNFTHQSLKLLLERSGFSVTASLDPSLIYSKPNNSICFLAKKQTGLAVQATDIVKPCNIVETKKQYYPDGYVPSDNQPFPSFHIPFINDLSISYKLSKENFATVEKNQQNRQLVFKSDYILIS